MLRQRYIQIFLLISVYFLAFFAYQVSTAYHAAKDAAWSQAQNLAHVLERDFYSDFLAAEKIAPIIAGEIPAHAMLVASVPRYQMQMRQLLKRHVAAVASAEALRVFDADGELLYSSRDADGHFNILDRVDFQKLKTDATLTSLYSETLYNYATGQASLIRMQALRDANRRFLGSVNVIIPLNALHQHIGKINLGPNGTISLRRLENGASVVRYPGPVNVDNTPVMNMPTRLAILRGERAGVIDTPSVIDGQTRLYGYRQIEDLPFYLNVGIAEQDYLAEWRRETYFSAAGVLLSLLVLAFIFYQWSRSEAQKTLIIQQNQIANEHLLAYESRYQVLTDTAADAIITIDSDQNIVSWNKAATQMFGYDAQQVIGQPITLIMPVSYRANHLDKIHAASAGGTASIRPIAHQLTALRQGGYEFPVEIALSRWTIDKQVFFTAFVRDVTERIARQQRLENLLTEQDALLNNELVGIFKSKDRQVVWANSAFSTMFGFAKGQMNGLPGSAFYASEKAYAEMGASAYPVLKAGKIFRGQFEFVRKDSSHFWCDISGILLNPDSREVLWCFVDVTDKVRQEAELRQAKDAAEAANQAKSRFLATMSHEIRTPMHGMMGMAQLLTAPDLTQAERVEYAGAVVESGQVLMALINDILDLSKIEAGKFRLENITLEPLPIMANVRDLFAPSASAKGLTLSMAWSSPSQTPYLGDPHRLTQMLSNLVSNAVKFTHQGSIHIQGREVESHNHSALLEFSVTDTGIGIAKDKLDVLFQAFSQVNDTTTRDYGGTGLGLSIVLKLAKLMGGSVGVESEPGQGSRFWLRIRVECRPTQSPS